MSNELIAEAFDLLRGTYPAAAEMIVEPGSEPISMWLHAVRATDGTLLWFDQDTYYRHPDAAAMGRSPDPDYDEGLLDDVEGLLREAHEDDPDLFVTADGDDYTDLKWSEGRELMIVTSEDAAE